VWRVLRTFRSLEPEIQEDLFQDVFAALLNGGLKGFRGSTGHEFRWYLKTIAQNEAKNCLRRHGRRFEVFDSIGPQNDQSSNAASVAVSFEFADSSPGPEELVAPLIEGDVGLRGMRRVTWSLIALMLLALIQEQPQAVAAPLNPTVVHLPARGCVGEHDALFLANGGFINFYPHAPPYRFDHLAIHYTDGNVIWGQPLYGSPDCLDAPRCRRAAFRLNPSWQRCVPSGHLYEVVTLDGRPVLDSGLLQVIDPATKEFVNLSLALAQTDNISVVGYLEFGLARLAEASANSEEAEKNLSAALSQAHAAQNSQLEALALTELGGLQQDSGGYPKALELYGRAAEKYQASNQPKAAADALVKMAELYRTLGDDRSAAEWYQLAYSESAKGQDRGRSSRAYQTGFYCSLHRGSTSADTIWPRSSETGARATEDDPRPRR
jgi:tetratricopeptide (TPR) repeat protein